VWGGPACAPPAIWLACVTLQKLIRILQRQSVRHLQLQLAMVAATMAMFLAALAINDWLFLRFEFAAGIN